MRRLLQVGKYALLQRAPIELCVKSPAVFLGRPEAGIPELGPVLLVRLELVTNSLDLIVHRPVHLTLGDLDFHLVRFLHEDLLVDQLIERVTRKRSLTRRIGRKREAGRALLIDEREYVAPEKRLGPDDGDNPVYWYPCDTGPGGSGCRSRWRGRGRGRRCRSWSNLGSKRRRDSQQRDKK